MTPPPGFVDLQLNGFAGIDFSAPGLALDDVRATVAALVQRGTVAFCPTIVTAPLDVYDRNLPVLARAMAAPDLRAHLPGIHLEGPFISPHDGPRGAHPKEHVRAPDPALLTHWQDLAHGHIRLLTLAPELDGARELIRTAVQLGITVSIGHSAADDAQLQAAVDAGARASTHLGNAATPAKTPRTSGVFFQLVCDRLMTMCITDGHHLPRPFMIAAVRMTAPERFLVVSDAAPVAGLPPGDYDFVGKRVQLEPSGRIFCPETGTLAGSSATMLDCMNVLASLHLLDEQALWQAGFHNPLALIGADADAVAALAPRVHFLNGSFSLIAPQE